MKNLIKAAQIIGHGLELQACRIELKRVSGDGVYWGRKGSHLTVGIWCSSQDWQRLVLAVTQISEPNRVDEAFLPCITATLLEEELAWILSEIEDKPSALCLLDHVHPVMTFIHPEVGEINIVLVNWPQKEWQPEVESWSPYAGTSATLSLSLVAGYIPQTSVAATLPEVGGGVWLENSARVEHGEALLWCDGAIAKVTLAEVKQDGKACLTIDELLPENHYINPPIVAVIAKVDITLAHLGAMMMEDKFEVQLNLCNEVWLSRQNEVEDAIVGTASLLRSEGSLLAQVNSLN